MLRKHAASHQKFSFLGLSTAGQTPCCPVSKVKWLQQASSPPTRQLRWEWELAAFPEPAFGGGFLAEASQEFSTTSVTAFIHPALQQTEAFLAVTILKE